MNGTKLLVDTNIALYFLGGDPVLSSLLDQREIYVSAITEMELLGYPGITQTEAERIHNFLNDCQLVEINADVRKKAIEIRRLHNLKLPDAIIAATALHLNLPLISADDIFSRIGELNFVFYAL
ncbi:MAG: type II toxin-antitoxin system VapC family toxin [Haliscomenobacteraceae bacterium CHB4]|nr:tRNA(fMet)-specific endonuclease VapC [Saprospiraceae bacterium]MCE7922070.1 type II toxin-antitoxin system VapC family toxin [Haliscomenobacteraceae bacterium CHB4]